MAKSQFHRLILPLMVLAGLIQWLVAFTSQRSIAAALGDTLNVTRILDARQAMQTVYWGNIISFILVTVCLVLLEREGRRRIEVEALLRRQQQQYASLLANIPDVPWQTDAQGAPSYVGPGFETLTGYTPAEIIDGDAAFWRTRVHDAHIDFMNEGFRRLFEENVPLDAEFRFQRKDGAWIWLYTRASTVFEEGNGRYTQGLVSDVTSRKAAQQHSEDLTKALAESNRQLVARTHEAERATRLKSRFLANMSHELRTPLNAIMGFSELLSEPGNGPLTEKQLRWVGRIRVGASHLLQLINDILDLSKIEADQLEFRPETVRLAEAVPDVMSIIRPLAQARAINLSENIPSDIYVEVDSTRLKQIIYNLLSNAVKFTPPHGLVRIEAQDLADYVCISVRDTGIGIRPEDQEIIFEEFRQGAPTLKGVPEGTGLGLSICRRLVERQGGKLWLESQVGKGSRFSFTVKRGRVQQLCSHHPTVPPSKERYTALVVDDEAVSRELLLSHLHAEGFHTLSAHDSAQTIELLSRHRPDLILLDLMLGDAEGWDLLQYLRNDPALAPIPVIVASIVDRKEKAYELGAVDYLVKPISRHALMQCLRRRLPALRPAASAHLANPLAELK